MTTVNPIESHAVHSGQMLDHAAEMLDQGDLLHASEKIWGAAAHRLKEIAVERGWPYDSHADGTVIARHIARQSNNRLIAALFGLAEDTRQNFYEDRLVVDELEERLVDISVLLELLDDAHRTLPPDLPVPHDEHYRRRHNASRP